MIKCWTKWDQSTSCTFRPTHTQ